MANEWWRGAVIYQIYIRSFGDGNGDGTGDIAGIRARLPYLARLGVDAIWINPWYPSPLADGGYDVADYRAIDPALGTLAEADALIADAHRHGLRVILDIVPNHTSSAHPWFQAALAAPPGPVGTADPASPVGTADPASPVGTADPASTAARDRYLFRDGRGPAGDLPPNNWLSVFGGSAWTRVPDGQWYLHMFAIGQPDLNWAEPAVRAEFEDILRFWFDRGVDGFRIDVANRMAKDPALPDLAGPVAPGHHPYQDRDELHDIYRGWRRVAEACDPPRVFVAEAWMTDQDRLARYVRGDELHTAFNFDFLTAPWDRAAARDSIDRTLAALGAVGAPATWVLSNHDVARHLSRFGRPPRAQGHGARYVQLDALADFPLDIELGTRRARAAALLLLALPGGAYVYQGDELGLWEVEDLPDEARRDPAWLQSGHASRGRDGCRVPLPWSGDGPPFGFGPPGSVPWLPQPPAWKALTAARQDEDPGSMLNLYRAALALRRTLDALGDGPLEWLPDVPDGVLAFTRGSAGFTCVVNYSAAEAWPLPDGASVLLASGPLPDGRLPADTAVWLAARAAMA